MYMVSFYGSSDNVEPIVQKVKIFDVVMQFSGQVFFAGREVAETVSKDHILSMFILYGEVILLHA